MTFKTAFPDFDYTPMINYDGMYYDLSFRNDVCPVFGRYTPDKYTVKVWCDYKDSTKRENPQGARFYVALYNENDEFIKDLQHTDNENTLHLYLVRTYYRTGAELISNPQTITT